MINTDTPNTAQIHWHDKRAYDKFLTSTYMHDQYLCYKFGISSNIYINVTNIYINVTNIYINVTNIYIKNMTKKYKY